MELQNLRHGQSESLVFDGSRPLFRPGHNPRVTEFLQAVPMLKADPAAGAAPNTQFEAFTMKVTVQRTDSLPTAGYYDSNNNVNDIGSSFLQPFDYPLARLGLKFSVPRLDAQATARHTAADAAEWRMYAAANAVLARLDTALARDNNTNPPALQNLRGLAALVASATTGRAQNAGASLEADIRDILTKITPSGMAGGEGPTCLVTGTIGLKRLMATTTGQQGQSGFRLDKRTGLNIYHYMGLPVYRVNVDDSVQANNKIWAMNLGGTGVNLVHAVGSSETYGLVCEEDHLSVTRATSDYVVHGAWSLVMWEEEAIWELSNVPLTPV